MTLRVTFLGTGGAIPTVRRNPSAVYVNREGDELLFDCAEGTQRQMMRFGTGFGIDHLFLTHLHGDHVFGVPGLTQTLDFNDREAPLAVHGPGGSRRSIQRLLGVGGATPSFPVRINEVTAGDVAVSGDGYEVRTVVADHDTAAVGYAIVEDDRKGRFDRERAEELGVPVGPKFSRLHEGHAVELDDGRVVEPDQVVGPPRPGRTVVLTGDTRPTDAVREAARDADLLVHDATFADDRVERAGWTGHSTARQAAEVATDAGARRLALVHTSSRYAGETDAHIQQAREVVRAADTGCEVFLPDDGDTVEVGFPDGG
jgi:ribonuclease Z